MSPDASPRLEARELTAPGRGAVAVLELRGPRALEHVRRLATRASLAPGGLELVSLRRGPELLDEALLWAASEERVELHLHGSPAVVRGVVDALGATAPKPPTALEDRAHALLADAASEAAARILLDQAQGALRRELETLREPGPDAAERHHALAERWRWMRHLVTPPRLVLAGPANAGKSTLFNVLVGRERVVVDEELGTTRDAVRERVSIGAYAVDLVDTAGEREVRDGGAAGRVERAGQRLGRAIRQAADLVLWLAPTRRDEVPAGPGPPTVVLRSRADERPSKAADPPALSALTRPAEARGVVERALLQALGLPREPWTPGQAVPFESGQAAVLERLRGAPGSDGVRDEPSALESLLAR